MHSFFVVVASPFTLRRILNDDDGDDDDDDAIFRMELELTDLLTSQCHKSKNTMY